MKKTLFLFLSAVCMISCSDTPNDSEPGKYRIGGSVQKGQYIKGSTIIAYELDERLSPTGKSYPSQITDDLGSFTIGDNLKEGYVELFATGYYYNEDTRNISESQLNLQAVESTRKSTINVNLLTSLSAPRIKKLVGQGMAFDKASAQAQREVLEAMGIDGSRLSERFTEMDISQGGDADAMLLAISCIFQKGKSTGDLSSLIAEFASDLADDGSISDALKAEIAESARYVNVDMVIEGLLNFYADKKTKQFTIPPFYKFLDVDGDGEPEGDAPIFYTQSSRTTSFESPFGESSEGFSASFLAISTFDFSVTTDSDWIEVDKQHLTGDIYRFGYTALPNPDRERSGEVLLRKGGTDGEILERIKVRQAYNDNLQYIYLSGEGPAFQKGDLVFANGKVIEVEEIELKGQTVQVVVLDRTAQFYVCYPVGRITPGESLYYCTVQYPATLSSSTPIPLYGALIPFKDFSISNPSAIQMQVCGALLEIDFSAFARKDEVASIQLEAETNGMLSGTATYNVYDRNYLPDLDVNNPSNRVEITIQRPATSCTVPICPQSLRQLTVRLLNAKGEPLATSDLVRTETAFRRGESYSFNIS